MQFKSILFLAASATLAVAKYDVGNCGSSNQDGVNLGVGDSNTQKACEKAGGEYCSAVYNRCVIETTEWDAFEKECDDHKAYKDKSDIEDKDQAKRDGLCGNFGAGSMPAGIHLGGPQ
ncbi:hypothetical protein ATEIFO6365_0006026000 [Aspergillus terreus]|uniref:Uncharacterized protein n=1 Tax=Aspergillus terreus TaxID=33178 RepID=A0A5M3YWD4_ASPTE|nr:hypothetical protein ATETN484_0005025800 [Aspergillus terreus]GFF16923.1 hypothetical protein ATEIFO6365_0006026000 [Aspergillus terreus]